MKTIIGIDVGGSTTKIVGFQGDKMIAPQFVKASDPLYTGCHSVRSATDNLSVTVSQRYIL